MDNKWHLHIPLESFAVSYALHRESVGDRPIVPQVQLSEGKPIALYSLLREVLEREGCHVVTRTRSWPKVAARLGYSTASANTSVWSNQSIAEQLKTIYEAYLLKYEEGLVANAAREVVSRWWTQHTVGNPWPYRGGAELQHWLDVMVLPGDQITNHGVPKDLVDALEHYRPVFAHVLRNSDEARKRHAWQARKAQLAQNVQPTNGSTHYDRYDWQRELSVAYNKRRRSASPASSTSSALSYDGPRAEKRPRVDSRTSPCESAHDAQFEHGTPIQIAPTEDAPSKEVAHPPQNKEPTGTHMRSVRKPTIPYRNPSVEELQDAQLWMTFYRREVLEKGFGGEPPQIAESEWPKWHSLFIEVRQLVSQVHHFLPSALCRLSEDAARGLASDIVKVEVQERYLDQGKRQGLFVAWQLSLIRDNLRGWLRWFYGAQR